MPREEYFSGLIPVRTGRELFVRKVRLFYEGDHNKRKSIGSPPKLQVVFIHGLCGTQSQFDPQLDELWEALSEKIRSESLLLDCLLYDWMGCGESPVSSVWKDYSRDETCSDLQALLTAHTDRSVPLLFVGHSYGPNIVLNLNSSMLLNAMGYVFIGSGVSNKESTAC